MKQAQLIDAVIDSIISDVYREDYTAIAELLTHVPEAILLGFLPEDEESIDIDLDGGLSAINE